MNTLSAATPSSTPPKARSTSAPTPSRPTSRVTSTAGDAACMGVLLLMARGSVTAAKGLR